MPTAPPSKPSKPRVTRRKLSATALRTLARVHTVAAVQALADVATKGNSEASRISAAMALLDRGYGRSGAGSAGDDGALSPVLYHRIELIDGTADKTNPGHPALDDKAGNDQD